MFCSQCGTQNEENATFCSNCGAPLNASQPTQPVEPTVDQSEEVAPEVTPEVAPEAAPVAAPEVAPQTFTSNVTPEEVVKKSSGSKKIIAIVIAAAVVLAFVFGAFALLGGGYSQSTPEKAVKSLFKSIYESDVDAFISMIPGEEVKALKEYMDDKAIKEYLEPILDQMNESIADEMGKDWIKEIKILDVDKDGDYASVEVEIDGESDTMELEKIDGKWYVDFGGLF